MRILLGISSGLRSGSGRLLVQNGLNPGCFAAHNAHTGSVFQLAGGLLEAEVKGLSVPLAMIGGLVGLLIMQQPLSLYGQIGMVLLIGMASKTAILIVEFGKSLREREGLDLYDATIKAARLRFRPVVMTALSFVVGVLP